jgi:hypothetical protein
MMMSLSSFSPLFLRMLLYVLLFVLYFRFANRMTIAAMGYCFEVCPKKAPASRRRSVDQ